MSYRRRLWRAIDRQKSGYRRAMRPVFKRAFDKQIQPFLNEIMDFTDITHIEAPIKLDPEPMQAAYKRLYMTAALDFAMQDRDRAKSDSGLYILKSEDEIIADMIMLAINDYMATEIGLTIEAIGDTSILKIQRILEKLVPEIIDSGIGGGAAQTALRDQIKSAWHRDRYFRTERIVRTEVNRASNWGSLKGVQSTGAPHYKLWLAAFTATSRPEHGDAEGQRVDIDEDFDVMGESLQYPGDPAGSAANTINCLCSMTYETKELTE
ncbi:hypothetical protein ES707_22419 [subsurface metagenome]